MNPLDKGPFLLCKSPFLPAVSLKNSSRMAQETDLQSESDPVFQSNQFERLRLFSQESGYSFGAVLVSRKFRQGRQFRRCMPPSSILGYSRLAHVTRETTRL